MVELPDASGWSSRRDELRYRVRVLHVLVLAEFKLKYQDSVLGYIWSIVRPLSLFTVMYLVFGRLFDLNEVSQYYGIALLTGIVLWSFFAEATAQGMVSLVARESLLRRLRFPNLSDTLSAPCGLLSSCSQADWGREVCGRCDLQRRRKQRAFDLRPFLAK